MGVPWHQWHQAVWLSHALQLLGPVHFCTEVQPGHPNTSGRKTVAWLMWAARSPCESFQTLWGHSRRFLNFVSYVLVKWEYSFPPLPHQNGTYWPLLSPFPSQKNRGPIGKGVSCRCEQTPNTVSTVKPLPPHPTAPAAAAARPGHREVRVPHRCAHSPSSCQCPHKETH